MEESIKIVLLGNQLLLSKEDIINLKTIITPATLKQIRIPTFLGRFTPKLDVLHSCLHYLIAVQKNLDQSHSIIFREKCLVNISEYYIQQHMNFELYQYGYLCAKLINIPIERVLHVIYFLIYTRLASKPYISNLIQQTENKKIHTRIKTIGKSQKELSYQSKSQQSRHLTVFCQSSQIQTQILKKQLQKILSPPVKKKMTKKAENKRYFNIKKVYPEDQDIQQEGQTAYDPFQSTNSTSRIAFIPIKVSNTDHSSIIEKLKMQSGTNGSNGIVKKVQVRRQKFNEWFDTSQKYEQLMSPNRRQNKRSQIGLSKKLIQKDNRSTLGISYKNAKHPFEYYQQITSNIKNKNDQLDNIRHECYNNKQLNNNNNGNRQIILNINRFNLLNKYTVKSQNSKLDIVYDNSDRLNTNRQVIIQNYSKNDYISSINKQNDGFMKSTSMSKFSQQLQQRLDNIITRKNDNIDFEQQIGILKKKIKLKNKTQKYKHDYRHFMKTQIFERVRQNMH